MQPYWPVLALLPFLLFHLGSSNKVPFHMTGHIYFKHGQVVEYQKGEIYIRKGDY